MADIAQSCPNCESEDLLFRDSSIIAHWIHCNTCGQEGPIKASRDHAIDAWNELPIVMEYNAVPVMDDAWFLSQFQKGRSMTIRVTVKNEDSGENRVISVQQLDDKGEPISGIAAKELKGGESCENHVHSTNQLLVREVKAE